MLIPFVLMLGQLYDTFMGLSIQEILENIAVQTYKKKFELELHIYKEVF